MKDHQRVVKNHVSLSAESVRPNPVFLRYAWPGGLDLMVRIVGLRLKERWEGSDRGRVAPDIRTLVFRR